VSRTAGLSQDLAIYQHPDVVYALFDDEDHVAAVLQLIDVGDSTRLALLDVGCGAGAMLGRIVDERPNWRYSGIDREAVLLKAAARRYPEVDFRVADLRITRLGRTFDVITCLGHTLSHQVSDADYDAALDTLAEHLRPGGLLLIDIVPHAVDGLMSPQVLTTARGTITLQASSVVQDTGFLDTTWTWQIQDQDPVTETFRQRATPIPDLTRRLWPRRLTLIDHTPDNLLLYQKG
jgi:trans-aconitate methyltransferase